MDYKIKKGDAVTFAYSGKLQNGTVFDSTTDKPAKIVVGQHQVIPGIELALEGMSRGQTKQVSMSPEDAYGSHDSNLIVKYPRSNLPPDKEPAPDMVIEMHKDDGSKTLARIVEVHQDSVILDLNHPLAGENVIFEITVLGIEPAQ